MHPLVREALKITKELGPVTFVGAVAVFLHTKNTRESQDLDFAIAKPITRDELLDKGYRFFTRNGVEETYTPREFKIDIYSERPLNDIPIKTIIETSKDFDVDRKGSIVNAMGLEALILAKFRANRPAQDYPDLRALAVQRLQDINWNLLETLSKNRAEFEDLKNTLEFMAKN